MKTQLAEVAERIRTMREITGLSEDEMAKCTGVTKEEYQKCEAGEADFSFTFIYKCAQRFGIDPTDLIKGVSPTLSTYTLSLIHIWSLFASSAPWKVPLRPEDKNTPRVSSPISWAWPKTRRNS